MTTTKPATINKYTFLGTTDEVDTCDCCGKQNLKVAVAIEDVETGTVSYFGTTCAARALKLQVAEVKAGARAADDAYAAVHAAAHAEWARGERAAWVAHVASKAGGMLRDFKGEPDLFGMIAKIAAENPGQNRFTVVREGYDYPAFVAPPKPAARR
jgi:hypothetical protein